ncbi:hypothetical protein [Acidobacterium sp. S8]|uniref:hypothetical protein n=1 Tax=Acidobacterium sp. S8 TaxID=1641854 RepID=UPI00131E831E|nr:hypothetical protein [Acidobacterium sp. S8]
MPLRDLNNNLFAYPLLGEVRGELLTQQASVRPNDTVLAGIVARMAMEDFDTDLLLGSLFRSVSKGAIRRVKKEFTETCRGLQVPAGSNSLD